MGHVELTGRLICANIQEAEVVQHHLPQQVQLTRAEPGCLLFSVQPTEDPLVWTVAEKFADEAAFEAHHARVRASDWGRATAAIGRDYVIT